MHRINILVLRYAVCGHSAQPLSLGTMSYKTHHTTVCPSNQFRGCTR